MISETTPGLNGSIYPEMIINQKNSDLWWQANLNSELNEKDNKIIIPTLREFIDRGKYKIQCSTYVKLFTIDIYANNSGSTRSFCTFRNLQVNN